MKNKWKKQMITESYAEGDKTAEVPQRVLDGFEEVEVKEMVIDAHVLLHKHDSILSRTQEKDGDTCGFMLIITGEATRKDERFWCENCQEYHETTGQATANSIIMNGSAYGVAEAIYSLLNSQPELQSLLNYIIERETQRGNGLVNGRLARKLGGRGSEQDLIDAVTDTLSQITGGLMKFGGIMMSTPDGSLIPIVDEGEVVDVKDAKERVKSLFSTKLTSSKKHEA